MQLGADPDDPLATIIKCGAAICCADELMFKNFDPLNHMHYIW